jgi:Holliday junction resolvase
VVRAAGSLGPFDLVAFNPRGLRLIQVKCNAKPRGLERAALEEFRDIPFGTTREVWVFRDGQGAPEIEVIT